MSSAPSFPPLASVRTVLIPSASPLVVCPLITPPPPDCESHKESHECRAGLVHL